MNFKLNLEQFVLLIFSTIAVIILVLAMLNQLVPRRTYYLKFNSPEWELIQNKETVGHFENAINQYGETAVINVVQIISNDIDKRNK